VDQHLFHRLHEFTDSSSRVVAEFRNIATETLTLGRKEIIRAQGERVNEVYFLIDGWVAGTMNVLSGRRQIVKVNLPGDVLGVPSLCLTHSALTLETLTPATVQVMPIEKFARLFDTVPGLGLTLFLITQQERVLLMERLASVGQTKAVQRVSAFLLHIHERLQRLDRKIDRSFDLPLTQAELAEIVGLTFVHVNRSLRELDRRGFIERSGKRITLIDPDGLRELAGLPDHEFIRDPHWLNGKKPRSQAGMSAPL
jgi:CRP-like cAMP-binding protein